MKKTILRTGSGLGLVVMLVGISLASEKTSSQKADPKMEEMMKKAEAAAKPGPAHKALDPLVGEWNADVKVWMEPNVAPMTSKGSATSTWDLQGRFVRQEFKGEFMGKPFRGLGFTGYDNVKQKYNNVWIDDMSTTIFTAEGEAEQGGKVLTFGGTYACAMTGEKNKEAKQV